MTETAEQRADRLATEGHDPECTAHYPGRACDCVVSRKQVVAALRDYARIDAPRDTTTLSAADAERLARYEQCSREVKAAQAALADAQQRWRKALDEFTEGRLRDG